MLTVTNYMREMRESKQLEVATMGWEVKHRSQKDQDVGTFVIYKLYIMWTHQMCSHQNIHFVLIHYYEKNQRDFDLVTTIETLDWFLARYNPPCL